MNDRSRLRLVVPIAPSVVVGAELPKSLERASDAPPLIVLTLLWIAIGVLVDPRGGFPLDDDWAYGRVALTLAEHGRFEPSCWQSMPLVTNALWAVPFVRIFGASGSRCVCRRWSPGGWRSRVRTSFCARSVGAARAPRRRRDVAREPMARGAVMHLHDRRAIPGHRYLGRVGLVARDRTLRRTVARAGGGPRDRRDPEPTTWPGAADRFRAAAATAPGVRERSWLAALVPIAATLAALLAHDCLRHRAAASTALYDGKLDALVQGTLELARLQLRGWQRVGARLGMALTYLGLFSLPITLVAARTSRHLRDDRAGLAAYSLGALAGVAELAAGWTMPFGSNTVMDFGIGPRTIVGPVPGAPTWLLRLLTILSCVGAAFLVRLLCGHVRASWRGNGLDERRWKPLAAALVAAALFVPSALADTEFFDRYLLASLPLLLAAAPEERSRPPAALTAVAGVIGAAFLFFSVGATHDYLAWHRARWAAIAAIEAPGGIAPADIQAGFEIDNRAEGNGLADRSCAPFVVSAALLPGHVPVRRIAVRAWLPGAVREIYVLARPRVGRTSAGQQTACKSCLCDPGLIRTGDLRFRKPLLYPPELRGR